MDGVEKRRVNAAREKEPAVERDAAAKTASPELARMVPSMLVGYAPLNTVARPCTMSLSKITPFRCENCAKKTFFDLLRASLGLIIIRR